MSLSRSQQRGITEYLQWTAKCAKQRVDLRYKHGRGVRFEDEQSPRVYSRVFRRESGDQVLHLGDTDIHVPVRKPGGSKPRKRLYERTLFSAKLMVEDDSDRTVTSRDEGASEYIQLQQASSFLRSTKNWSSSGTDGCDYVEFIKLVEPFTSKPEKNIPFEWECRSYQDFIDTLESFLGARFGINSLEVFVVINGHCTSEGVIFGENFSAPVAFDTIVSDIESKVSTWQFKINSLVPEHVHVILNQCSVHKTQTLIDLGHEELVQIVTLTRPKNTHDIWPQVKFDGNRLIAPHIDHVGRRRHLSEGRTNRPSTSTDIKQRSFSDAFLPEAPTDSSALLLPSHVTSSIPTKRTAPTTTQLESLLTEAHASSIDDDKPSGGFGQHYLPLIVFFMSAMMFGVLVYCMPAYIAAGDYILELVYCFILGVVAVFILVLWACRNNPKLSWDLIL